MPKVVILYFTRLGLPNRPHSFTPTPVFWPDTHRRFQRADSAECCCSFSSLLSDRMWNFASPFLKSFRRPDHMVRFFLEILTFGPYDFLPTHFCVYDRLAILANCLLFLLFCCPTFLRGFTSSPSARVPSRLLYPGNSPLRSGQREFFLFAGGFCFSFCLFRCLFRLLPHKSTLLAPQVKILKESPE